MADSADFATAYKRYEETLKRANALNKAAVFDALEKAGIDSATVEFNGEGDSGQIESVTAYKKQETIGLPQTFVPLRSVAWGSDAIAEALSPFAQAIESLCYGYLLETHGGWENNDGAFGEFTLDVEARQIELDFTERFTDHTNYSYTF